MTGKILENSSRINALCFWIILFTLLLPWLIEQSQTILFGNTAWLLIAAERMLNGENMLMHIYEPNPPLNIFIYIPFVLFSRLTGLSIHYSVFSLTIGFLALSLYGTNALLKRLDFLDIGARRTILIGILIASTFLSKIMFADREYIMVLALLPLLLAQYIITLKINMPKRLLWPVLVIGSLLILMKPHYGVLPAAIFIHRAIVQNRLSVFRDPDFIILALTPFLYLGMIWLFTPEYMHIMKDVLDLYVSLINIHDTFYFATPVLACALSLFVAELLFEDLTKNKRHILLFFYGCTLLGLIPALVQMKGYYNHILPTLSFLLPALLSTCYFRLEKLIQLKQLRVFIPALFFLPVFMHPFVTTKPTLLRKNEVLSLPLAQLLQKECPSPCTFFAFNDNIEIIPPIALYLDYPYGSRFPSYWVLPSIVSDFENLSEGKATKKSLKELSALQNKFAEMTAEDLNFYKPDLLLIGTNFELTPKKNFNFVEFFSVNKHFLEELSHYKKQKSFEMNRQSYFRGTSYDKNHILRYDIYRRKD